MTLHPASSRNDNTSAWKVDRYEESRSLTMISEDLRLSRVLPRLTAWWRARTRHAYDIQVVEVMRRILAPDSVCLDVGANEGGILREMVRAAPLGAHVAFEPIPRLASQLRRKFPGVRIHQVAIGDATGESEFLLVQRAPGYSGLRRRVYPWEDPRIVTVPVNVARLDDLAGTDEPVRFMKLDIEGGEYHALLGARKLVQRHRPVIVFEAGWQSTGQYGVTASDMFDLVVAELRYDLSTMARWLEGALPLTREQFMSIWSDGSEWMFLATPSAEGE
jgi:FkbM family methyltransferase